MAGVDSAGASTSEGTDGAALPWDIAQALPPTGEPVGTGPGDLSALRATVRSWTTLGGVKGHARLLFRARACPPIRRALSQGGASWVKHLSPEFRARFELDGGLVDPLRVELGSGGFPSPGYVHVDADRRARHVEHIAAASSLPFADGTVEELLAVHILEHVHASVLIPTLREWRRVLRPGGFAQIHVPDAATVFAAFLENPPEKKWTVMIPIFGRTSHARDGEPDALDLERHHVIYDFPLLESVLLEAGFDRVDDVSTEVTDRHTQKWRDDQLVARISLVVRAYAGSAPAPAHPAAARA